LFNQKKVQVGYFLSRLYCCEKPEMIKNKLTITLCLFTSMLCHGQILINHTSADITTLTENEINLAKNTLHIAYGHTSHGSQLITGMNSLITFANNGGKGLALPNNIFSWNNGGTSGALDLHDYAMGGDVGYYPQWYNNTVAYLNNSANADVNVIMWSWCGQASGYTNQNMIDYFLTPMTALESAYPNVKFVYMTGHLDGTGLNGNLNQRNNQIRAYCLANNKILYDFADIESYDPNGLINYMLLNCTDECWYDSDGNGSRDKNWAQDWRAAHTQNVDWYSCSPAHTDALNGNLKAYAAWRLFAEIAKQIVLDNIPENQTVTNRTVPNGGTECFSAKNTLSVGDPASPVVFQNGSNGSFIAGHSITLFPGFHAQAGSEVQAYITTDNGYCGMPQGGAAQAASPEKSLSAGTFQQKEKRTNNNSIKVYPNPNNGQFTIELSGHTGPTELLMFNASGRLVHKQTCIENGTFSIENPAFDKGLYFLRIQNQGEIISKKVLIRK